MLFKILLPLIILSGCGKTSSSSRKPTQLVSDELPSTLVVCYEDSRALPSYKNNKNYLAFENFGHNGIGRCRGHAIVSQTMEMLSKFEPHKSHPCLGQDATTCYSTLYKLITEIMSGNIRSVGGFDSLYAFSQDPTALRILRMKVASISHRYSATDSDLESYEHGSRNANIYHDIIRRLKLHHRPYVGIQGKYRIGNHAVIAYEVRSSRICVRDPNIVIKGSPFEDCQNYFYLKDDEVFYHQATHGTDEELLTASLQTDEDSRVNKYIRQHYLLCLSSLL